MAGLEYGLIGNCQTAALVSKTGSIEWACMPTFESPSVFARLLDGTRGGFFAVEPVGEYTVTQQTYLRNTNILETTFEGIENGQPWSFKVTDFMPRWDQGVGRTYYCPCEINRLVEVLQGTPQVIIRFDPRFNYDRGETQLGVYDPWTLLAMQGEERLFLASNLPARQILDQTPVSLGEDLFFALSYQKPIPSPTLGMVQGQLQRTTTYWRRWVTHCYLPKNYQAVILRSALTLKLLYFQETGAFIAAPTTSLPEIVGGNRTWDYRFCWLRDSYFIISALLKVAHFEETEGFIAYLKGIMLQRAQYVRPMYTIQGKVVPEEITLDHLDGYYGSKPVRVGNNATTHYQNDVYGEMMLSLYPLFTDERIVRGDTEELWGIVKRWVTMCIKKFDETDNGIWEFRNYPRHYTFSKLLCWVALDRGAKIAKKIKKESTAHRWGKIARAMKREILEKAWNPDVGAFTQAYGSHHLDASTLLMGVLGFIDPADPRMRATVLLSEEKLMNKGLAFRYTNEDDFGKPENAFSICTFWLIDALILIGETDRARRYFENILGYANHLGLFSEDINPTTGEMTGNFPQGYTHVAIINTAMLLADHWPL